MTDRPGHRKAMICYTDTPLGRAKGGMKRRFEEANIQMLPLDRKFLPSLFNVQICPSEMNWVLILC